MMDRMKDLPDWPARMTAPVAAAYIGVSETAFLGRFGSIGVKEGRNRYWARMQLDRYIAAQFDIPLTMVSHIAEPLSPFDARVAQDALRSEGVRTGDRTRRRR